MDEGWGNIIYLILLIVFGVFGALKKKKPVAVSPPDDGSLEEVPASKNQPFNKFESVLETLMGQEIPKVYQDEIEEDFATEKEEILDTVPKKTDPKKSSIEYTDVSKSQEHSTLGFHFNEEEEEEYESEEIDWRQAIIYKEILERKYN